MRSHRHTYKDDSCLGRYHCITFMSDLIICFEISQTHLQDDTCLGRYHCITFMSFTTLFWLYVLLFESIHFNLLNNWHYWCYPVVTTMYEILSPAWAGDLCLIWQIICFCLQCYFINQWYCVGVITLPAWAGIVFITLYIFWHSWYCS